MAKTQYYTATTLDGFLADADNSLDWLFEVEPGGDAPYESFLAGVGAMIMGATTYRWVHDHGDLVKWNDYYGDRPGWVFTHRSQPVVPEANLTFVQGDVRPVHEAAMTAAGGRNVWMMGGGELAGQFADAGLLDEIILGVAPVTLGAGAPLLPRRLSSSRLSLTSVERVGQFAYLTYSLGSPDSPV